MSAAYTQTPHHSSTQQACAMAGMTFACTMTANHDNYRACPCTTPVFPEQRQAYFML